MAPQKPEPIVIGGQTVKGRIRSAAWKWAMASLRKWPDLALEIEIRPVQDTRSARANRFLWGYVYREIVREMQGRVTAAALDELHECMKLRHNPIRVTDPVTGEERIVGGSTRRMSISEFSDFIEAVMVDGSEAFGIIWREPRADEDWRKRDERTEAA